MDGLSFNVGIVTSKAERMLLATAMTSPMSIDLLAIDKGLAPDDFQFDGYGLFWKCMLEMHADDQVIDAVTITAKLTETLDPYDAKQLVQSIITEYPEVAATSQYVRIVKDGVQRSIWQASARDLSEATVTGNEELAYRAAARLAGPVAGVEDRDSVDPDQLGHALLDYLEDTSTAPGISCGIPALDRRLGGGFRPGDTTALAGLTNIGKTVLVDQFVEHAMLLGNRCHVYTNETSFIDRGLRVLARKADVDHTRLSVKDITPDEAVRINAVAQNMPFGITDCAQWDAEQIARHIRTNKWDLCVLDYLHKMPYKDVSELDRIVSVLTGAARSSGAHLLLVCQLNEERNKTAIPPEPVMRDLRGSGAIKQACKNVLFVHREHKIESGLVFVQNDGYVELAKGKHGPLGSVPVNFNAEAMRFDPAPTLRAVAS